MRCEIWLPINTFSAGEPEQFHSQLGHYQQASRFISRLKESKANRSRILDLNQVLMVLIAIANMYLKLLVKAGMATDRIHSKVILSDVWRTIPFLDSGTMQDRTDKYGLPVCLTRNAMAPGGTDLDSFFAIRLLDDDTVPNLRMQSIAFMLLDHILFALGLQGPFTNDSKDEAHSLIVELIDAWERTRRTGPAS